MAVIDIEAQLLNSYLTTVLGFVTFPLANARKGAIFFFYYLFIYQLERDVRWWLYELYDGNGRVSQPTSLTTR